MRRAPRALLSRVRNASRSRSLALGARARGRARCAARAQVGCVLVAADGETIAEGFHAVAGAPHAEAMALAAAGPLAAGATAYVSLEVRNCAIVPFERGGAT